MERLFIFIFGKEENREWTLNLYNAINGSDYTDASLCGPLMEYSWFVDKIREHQKDNSLEDAVKKTIEEMPKDFRIKSFLVAHME